MVSLVLLLLSLLISLGSWSFDLEVDLGKSGLDKKLDRPSFWLKFKDRFLL